tara:strand:+ start:1872 stop:4250 length:2379 start_codon:yes stop_codon:yes gene_type:complete
MKNSNKFYDFSSRLALALCLLASGGTAYAQSDDAPTASQGGLSEIVVTAERRSTNLQDVPIAVTAFTGAALEQARVQNFGDLVTKIPGFSINSLSKARTNPALRGGSSTLSAPGADNAVALFIDDIYYGSSGDFELDLFDLERVEVLRGPQGTLFGRNSTGGSIAVITKEPSADQQGSVEISVGNYDLVQARGYVTGPLNESETLLGSIAFSATNQRGTSYNRFADRRADNTNRGSVRAKLKWIASDDVSVIFSGDYNRKSETNEARDFLGAAPTADGLVALGFTPDTKSRTVDQFEVGEFDSTSWGLSAKIEANFDAGTLFSITGYRKLRQDQTPVDLLGLPVVTIASGEQRRFEQFSQELRWVSPSDGRFNYVAGLFFLHQNDSRDYQYRTLVDPSTFGGAFQAGSFCPDLQGDELNFAVPECVASRPELFDLNRSNTFQKSKVDSYAAYLQGTYELIDNVKLTLGGRITHDRKTASGYTRGDVDFLVNPTEVPGGFEGFAGGYRLSGLKDSWTAFTPKATLDWKVTDDVLLYGTVSRGFRSGAYQFEAEAATAAIPVAPEYVWNYEAGFKSRFFDNRAQLNVAVFQADYEDLQFTFTDGGTGNLIVSNAGKARVRGVEVEAMLIPVDGLTLSASYSHQDGEVKGFPEEVGIPDGQPTGQTPPHSLNLGATFNHAFANGGELTLTGDFQYKSKYQLELNPDPAFTTRVKSLVNASMSYKTPNGKWDFTLWGKNLTNEDIKVYGQDFRFMIYTFDEAYNPESPSFNPAAASASMPRYAPPRTYGATVRYNF